MTNEPVKRGRGRPRKNLLPVNAPIGQARVGEKAEGETPAPSASPSTIKVFIFPKFKEDDIGGIARVVLAQKKHLPQFGIEIVDNEDDADLLACHAGIPPAFIKRFPRKPIVSLCHGMYWSEYEWDNWSYKTNADVMESIRIADAVATCSEWVANSIRRHTSRPVSVIPHGIDVDDWTAGDNRGYVLWNKTRPDPVCDPTPVNQVAALLPDIEFVSTFGKETDNVHLTGQLPFQQAKALVEHANIYLCTTRETFGIGTLEALACGVPIVGYRWAGQAEFIEHEVDGYLVNPGDIEGLAKGIKWAIENRERLAYSCRKKAQAYSWVHACEEYATLFKEIYERKTVPAPRTSVIVTNYQLHDFLDDCLESVANQDDDDWECIIVDDASPDQTGVEIAMKWVDKDPRFKLIANRENVYLAEARNIGIRRASGRYILPLDADDMLAPWAISELADALDKDRSIHVAYGSVMFVQHDGRTKANFGFSPGHSSWPYPFSHEQQIMQRNLLPYSSMYRRTAWEWTGGYRRRCRTAEDADMWTRFSSYGFRPKMVTERDTLVYRLRNDSMSHTLSSEWIRWFSWTKMPGITPAGAVTKEQLPIPSLDPILISVIIPMGPGHEKIVTDAIDSVDTQSFRNWECILINDTGKPIQTELPSWVRVIATEGKTGAAHSRNVGIKASRGRVYLPLDADDYLEPDALQMMYSAFLESKDVIYTDFWEDPHEPGKYQVFKAPDYDAHLLTKIGCIHTVTALTPKVYWEKVGGYDEKLTAWEDWDFQIALANQGICSRRIALPLFVYRKHTGYRRESNYETFTESKQGIIQKWGSLWEGGKELMACNTCGGRRTSLPQSQNGVWASSQPRTISSGDDAVLIEYFGPKLGAVPYRGPSKTVYYFAQGDKKYVLRQDLEIFRARSNEFRVVTEVAQEPAKALEEPILFATGQG